MICPACGKTNIDSAAFCEQCGASLRPQPVAGPAVAAPPPPPQGMPVAAAPAGVSTSQLAQQGQAIIAAMSLGEKISSAGAIVALIAFFLPWVSVAIPALLTEATTTRLSGLDLGKTAGAVYLIPLIAAVAAGLCYLSSKAAPPKKLAIAGWLVFIGALCGPANLLALIFVSQLQSIAGFGLWLFSLGYTAIAAGGLMTIREFSKRVY
ncbi:MAG TPA: zinc ribbon domain-containing protein [Terracidiphilus sp.]|nr:zinc ribbon domain-containing protein [Terracidiphilus sp.]